MSTNTSVPDDLTHALPRLADRYDLLEKLGQGGMGAVWLARDTKLDRKVAVKVLPPESVDDPAAIARFQREAKALAHVTHPGIVQAFDTGSDDGQQFLVMEYVEGQSLAGLLKQHGRVSPTRAADYAHQAALALTHAHEQGLIHRDIKPSNLLLTKTGQIKILDLGLARFLQDQIGDSSLTREGVGMGTPDYAPPEQFRDAHSADIRSDIYSLGCTLYHLIAGQVPFPGSSLSEKFESHQKKEPPPLEEFCPDVPGGLQMVVQRMLAKRPADRFRTARDVTEALSPFVASSSASFQVLRNTARWDGSQLTTRTGSPRRRRVLPWAILGLASLAVLVLVGIFVIPKLSGRGSGPQIASVPPPTSPDDTNKSPPVPPHGVAAADDPNLLTVSQKAEGGGKFRTITAALESVRTGQTIRVIDDAVYSESILLSNAGTQANVTLEAPKGATLEDAGKFLIEVRSLSGVSIRGFRLRCAGTQRSTLVLVRGQCPGIELDGLEFKARTGQSVVGVEIVAPEVLDSGKTFGEIRNCSFQNIEVGIFVAGFGVGGGGPTANGRISVRENRFIDSAVGVSLVGQIQQIQVVGNSFSNFQLCGVQLERPIPDTRDVLIANNTFMDGTSAIRLWGPRVAGANIRISNNLILGRRAPDMFAYKARSTNAADGPGDGEAVSKVWSFGHNWREAVKPSGENAKGWIPPSAKDVVMEKIDGLDRDPKSPTFLRPAKDSPLATQGAGNEDPSLPRYVGALPPAGESAWDWERGWRMPPDAQLLTVSKEAKDGGKYRTISAALDDVKPWATIRVLDDAKYTEELLINRPNIHNHLMIESIKGAKLEITGVQNVLIQVLSIHGLTIRGFHLIADHTANSTLIFLQGKCSDILLERLTFRPGQIPGQFNGVEINDLSAGGRSPRVVVRHCTFVRAGTAVNLIGVKSDYSIPTPVHHIAIVDNQFSECGWGVVAKGAVSDVCVAGNQFLFCLRAATQVERLLDDVHDVVFANNTSIGSPVFFRVWDDRVRTGDVRVVANLSLETTYPDYLALDNGGTPDKLRALGDGAPFAKAWVFSRNWREVKLSEKSGAKPDGWIAPSSTDHRLDQITGVDRDRQTANYLHPAKDSPLSNQGAGREDPALPQYVGALPPEGVEPWDWDRSWRWNSRGALAAE